MAEAGGRERLRYRGKGRLNRLLAAHVLARAALTHLTFDKGPRQLDRVQVIEDDRAGE